VTAKVAFKQDDVKRAVAGVLAAGVEAATIRLVPGGEIVIQIGGASDAAEPSGEWNDVLEEARQKKPS